MIAASLPAGAWAEPDIDDPAVHEIVVLAAVLKALGAPAPMHHVRRAAALAREPHLLTPLLPEGTAADWRRVIGDDAEPLPRGAARLPRSAYAWGAAVRQLRGSDGLLEDLDAKTWAPGPALDEVRTDGWPDGRAGFVLEFLRQRGR